LFLVIPYRAMCWLWNWLLLLSCSGRGIIPEKIMDRTAKAMRGGYTALIGIEKGGLIWARAIARRRPAALIYWSLELYTRSYSFIGNGIWHRRMKLAEEVAHNNCCAMIVQDAVRGKILLADNRITKEMQILYVPISRMDRSAVPHTSCWRSSLGINPLQIVI